MTGAGPTARRPLRPQSVGPVRVFAAPAPAATAGARRRALFLDRQDALLRTVCSRSRPSAAGGLAAVRRALDRVRQQGTLVAVASHNRADSWDGFDTDEIAAMHDRIEDALGPIALWCVCRVAASGACACSTAASGVVATGADAAGVAVDHCAVATRGARMAAAADRAGVVNLLTGPPPPDGADAVALQAEVAQAVEGMVGGRA
ncbi:MAG: hypothetical protein ACYCU7_05250 [Acidimicrobiales bacterium]